MIPSTHLSLLESLKDPARLRAAWERFQNRYQETISGWCLHRGLQPAAAEAVTPTVLARLFQALRQHQQDPSRPFRCWLAGVVNNGVRDLHRTERRHPGDRGQGGSDFQNQLANLAAADSV